ncbi:hypothetical protein AB0L82_22185 [Nocardia sp. NPDC052001]|uniref:hypothetical protein n=1 Tax=Nocardia sp. NPDC052001 TaxID=3154853 RepID=UPI00343AC231
MGTAIVAGIFSLIGGGIGSIVGPLIGWNVTKWGDDRKHQRQLIDTWRTGISELAPDSNIALLSWYPSLQGYLPDDLTKALESGYGPRTYRVPPETDRNPFAPRLITIVNQLEHDWGLSGRKK